jgi:DNA polymerase-3 subunit gamma/tau
VPIRQPQTALTAAEQTTPPKKDEARPLFSSLAAAPANTKSKATLNLKSIHKTAAAKEAAEETPLIPEAIHEPVDFAALERAWKEFADTKKNQPAEYTLLQRPLEFEPPIIHIYLGNPVEEPLLAAMQTELLNFLRTRLRNHGLMLNKHFSQRDEVRVIYTNKEKFDHMASKNPVLLELKKRWALDPEF